MLKCAANYAQKYRSFNICRCWSLSKVNCQAYQTYPLPLSSKLTWIQANQDWLKRQGNELNRRGSNQQQCFVKNIIFPVERYHSVATLYQINTSSKFVMEEILSLAAKNMKYLTANPTVKHFSCFGIISLIACLLFFSQTLIIVEQ